MRIKNKSIQQKNQNYLMYYRWYNYIGMEITKCFEMLKDDIVCIEEEVSAREYIMNESILHIMVNATVLSYPSSLQEQAMNMPNLLQVTRIGNYGLWQATDFVGAIQKYLRVLLCCISEMELQDENEE